MTSSQATSPATVLLTGATGYIGSHTWLALLAAGYQVVGMDNFVNSSAAVIDRLEKICGQSLHFVEGDVRDPAVLQTLFTRHKIDAVVHFAALKAVGESTIKPIEYYDNNISGLLTLCAKLREHEVTRFVFSSSATVYGNPASVPITEAFPLSATNPYGQTKLMSEQILRDIEAAMPAWKVAYLRYFNPVGAHASGTIGEDPAGIPNNLMPYIAQVAAGKREQVSVYGNDYDTPDGTGVRDYIHVSDLAEAHVKAIDYLLREKASLTVNIGTGRGYSVLEVIEAYRRASAQPVPHTISPRRPGDIASCYANPELAFKLLGWRATRTMDDMCQDSWRWQSQNPDGMR